ncbi:MAG: DUF2232 domain-containing protein [Gammaproteobacteria bacterium]|jgi:hypothetical protein
MGAFIMAGRWQAVLATVGLAALSLVLPPIALLSGAAVALVTLRLGVNQGVTVAALASLAMGGILWAMTGNPVGGLVYGMVQWLPIIGVALVLRATTSWSLTLQAGLILGVLVVLGIHLLFHDPAAMWKTAMEKMFGAMLAEVDGGQKKQLLEESAKYMSGVFAGSLAIGVALSMFIGRYWQAALYNPGGFGREFRELRLGHWPAFMVIALVVVSLVFRQPLFVELLMVPLALYFLQGVALVHGLVYRLAMNGAWLFGLYVLLFFLLPQMILLLAVFGVVDSFADFRSRVQARPRNDNS